MKKRILCALVALAAAAPLLAQAAEGWVVDDISLQAGPDMDFPAIADLEAGTPVSIQGCIDGWRWCDVVAEDERGWVPGSYLEEDVGGRPVVVIEGGPRIGIPIVSFSLGTYWDRHYHNRPFYAERQRYESHRIAAAAPPRPSRVVANAPRHDVHVRSHTDFAAQVRGNTQGQDTNRAATETTTSRPSGDNRTVTRERSRESGSATASASTATQQNGAPTSGRDTRSANRASPDVRPSDQKPTDMQADRRSAQRQTEPQPGSPTDTRRQRPAAEQPQPAQPEQKAPTNMASAEHARHESGRQTQREEPKPKDELKKPNSKSNGSEKDKDNNGGG